jgi:hypothetical protein
MSFKKLTIKQETYYGSLESFKTILIRKDMLQTALESEIGIPTYSNHSIDAIMKELKESEYFRGCLTNGSGEITIALSNFDNFYI